MEQRKRSAQRWAEVDKTNVPSSVIAEQYLASCKVEGKTPSTLRGYKEKLGRFVRWFDGPLGEYSIPVVREYIAMLQGAHKWEGHPFSPQTEALVSAQTVANHVRVLKGFATWLFEETYTETNLLGRLSLPKAPRKVIEILTDAEIGKLTGACDADTSLGSRDHCIVLMLLDTGLRRSELVSLRVDELALKAQKAGEEATELKRSMPPEQRHQFNRYMAPTFVAGCHFDVLVNVITIQVDNLSFNLERIGLLRRQPPCWRTTIPRT